MGGWLLDGFFVMAGHTAGCVRILPARGHHLLGAWDPACTAALRTCRDAGKEVRRAGSHPEALSRLGDARGALRIATKAAEAAQRQRETDRWVEAMGSGPTAAAESIARVRRRGGAGRAAGGTAAPRRMKGPEGAFLDEEETAEMLIQFRRNVGEIKACHNAAMIVARRAAAADLRQHLSRTLQDRPLAGEGSSQAPVLELLSGGPIPWATF